MSGDEKLTLLRAEMSELGLAAFIVGSEDAHQSEYVCERDCRRAFISGFTGSSGTALVTMSNAYLWTDGRYFLQAEQQLSSDWTLMKSGETGVLDMNDWLVENLPADSNVGVDAYLISAKSATRLVEQLGKNAVSLVSVPVNIVDKVWSSIGQQPNLPTSPVTLCKYAGRSSDDKIREVAEKMTKSKADAFIVTMLDEICWLFNIRGADVECNPVNIAYAAITMEPSLPTPFMTNKNTITAHLFIDSSKISSDVFALMSYDADSQIQLNLHEYNDIEAFTRHLADQNKKVAVDMAQINWRLYLAAGGKDEAVSMTSPITLAKSIKNEVELQGIRNAHQRDGVALTAFLHWLRQRVESSDEKITEYEVTQKIEEFRGKMEGHVGPSFSTIAGYGENGAIIHYKPSEEGSAELGTESLFLLDSGGQYWDGTTDVTRTVCFNKDPSTWMKVCYTLVLQGHIQLATSVFPEGTMGSRLDAFARSHLWKLGLDYNHGTGHGVGAFLNVHEGPQGIGARKRENEVGFQVGMTTSNEPGYYEQNKFGIRIENICITVKKDAASETAGRTFCGFETVTMCPLDRRLIKIDMLSMEEIKWIDSYHQEVREKLLGGMQQYWPESVAYLTAETAQLL